MNNEAYKTIERKNEKKMYGKYAENPTDKTM